jgi:hypothetical protein
MKTEDAGVIQIEDDEEPVNPKLRKPMAARSEAWEHFTKVLDSNGKVKEGLCKYCNRPIQATTAGNGTSSMHWTCLKRKEGLGIPMTVIGKMQRKWQISLVISMLLLVVCLPHSLSLPIILCLRLVRSTY